MDFDGLADMISTWLRNTLLGSLGIIVIVSLLFSYVCWLSPASRVGKHNQQYSYLVRPGMTLSQALHILGPPQGKRTRTGGGVIFIYPAHPFAADDVYLSVGPDNIVNNINHGE